MRRVVARRIAGPLIVGRAAHWEKRTIFVDFGAVANALEATRPMGFNCRLALVRDAMARAGAAIIAMVARRELGYLG